MAEKIKMLQEDIDELETLLNLAKRSKVKDLLSLEIRKLIYERDKLQNEKLQHSSEGQGLQTSIEGISLTSAPSKKYVVKLNNYAWDQNSKAVKFYITVPKIETIPHSNIVCKFGKKNFDLNIQNLNNKDYSFIINHLLEEINPEESSWKIKTDMIVVSCAKVKNTQWSYVTELEKKTHDSKFDMNTDKMDPAEGLMSIMKNMYEKGDDDMKRTIAKAWTESQMKNSTS